MTDPGLQGFDILLAGWSGLLPVIDLSDVVPSRMHLAFIGHVVKMTGGRGWLTCACSLHAGTCTLFLDLRMSRKWAAARHTKPELVIWPKNRDSCNSHACACADRRGTRARPAASSCHQLEAAARSSTWYLCTVDRECTSVVSRHRKIP